MISSAAIAIYAEFATGRPSWRAGFIALPFMGLTGLAILWALRGPLAKRFRERCDSIQREIDEQMTKVESLSLDEARARVLNLLNRQARDDKLKEVAFHADLPSHARELLLRFPSFEVAEEFQVSSDLIEASKDWPLLVRIGMGHSDGSEVFIDRSGKVYVNSPGPKSKLSDLQEHSSIYHWILYEDGMHNRPL